MAIDKLMICYKYERVSFLLKRKEKNIIKEHCTLDQTLIQDYQLFSNLP